MKKITGILLAVLTAFSAMTAGALAAESSYAGKTVLLYTANLRGDVDMYARVKAAADAYEAAGAEVLLADAGNYLQGTAAANSDRGLSVYNLMDAAGYDVAAMGLAEFGYTDAVTGYLYHNNFLRHYTQAELQTGAEAMTYRQGSGESAPAADRPAKAAAGFRTVAANVTASYHYALEAGAVITAASGLTVGFYGLTDPAVAERVQDGYVTVSAPAAADLDADVTVCLTNAPVTGEGWGDIVIDASAGEKLVGAYVIGGGTITAEEPDLSGSDEAVAALAARAKENAAKTVGSSRVILNGSDRVNWNGESNLGDLTADALAWYAKNYVDGLDAGLPVVAIQNGGNCDNFLYTGEITETDLLKALPFSPMGLGVVYLTGDQLLETLEAAAQRADCPGFAQVSGLRYTLNTGVDYDGGAAYGDYLAADSVNRVTITEVDGKPFDPAAAYALVCDNFLMNGSDTYYTLPAAREAGAVYLNNGSGVKTRDAVALYIRQALGGVIGEEYARPQGRITVINEPGTEAPPPAGQPDPQPGETPAPAPDGTYTVTAGDSLWSIAKKTLGAGSRWELIYQANREVIRDPDRIYAGQVLKLPAGK